jgi:nitronate monooxygenase
MLRVSGLDLARAACHAGAIGAFPTANARTGEELDRWLTELERAAADAETPPAPHCPNLIIRQPNLAEHLAVLVKHAVEVVITSVGSPAPVVSALHDVGTLILSDVATLKHARQALAAGADGLVLLTAGAGGQTGWLNGFAFVRAVRAFFDGPIVLAGGIGDGQALFAATALGCDLGYMGTRFIAASESLASDEYKQMVVESSIDDVMLTKAFTGLQTSMLRPAIVRAGLDPDKLDEQVTVPDANQMYGAQATAPGPKRWTDIFSAGHSVSGALDVRPAAEIIAETAAQYGAARAALLG